MPTDFNTKIRQLLLLGLLILLFTLSLLKLEIILPGMLGAVTFYILSRANNFQLVYTRKWSRGKAAGVIVMYYLFLLGLPVFLGVSLITPKINTFLNDPTGMINAVKQSVLDVQQKSGFTLISEKSLTGTLEKITNYIPTILNSTANLVSNLVTMLFFLYYMLYNSREMEQVLYRIIPLKDENTNMLASETRKIVKANALGIPLIALIQGVTATIGYLIFGVQEWALWGFLTGVFAFFPIVGTMLIWVPLVIYMFTTGDTAMAAGLTAYSVIVTGNADYVARITIMRKLGDVHPVITVLGVIAGLNLFGFIGLIFGPLLINYIIILFQIYLNEFAGKKPEQKKAAVAGTGST
jgi:predicted PurR-regulated permease PerM